MRKHRKSHRFLRIRMFLISDAKKRTKILKKKHVFYSMGENVHFQPRKIPADPKFIKIGNNVSVASDVTFVTHDIIHRVFNNTYNEDPKIKSHLGCIEVCDNVFIGTNAIVLPNVKIGPNAIVAAGAIVTKDVPEGSIVGGNPAEVIGSFKELYNKRRETDNPNVSDNRFERIEDEWVKFNSSHK